MGQAKRREHAGREVVNLIHELINLSHLRAGMPTTTLGGPAEDEIQARRVRIVDENIEVVKRCLTDYFLRIDRTPGIYVRGKND